MKRKRKTATDRENNKVIKDLVNKGTAAADRELRLDCLQFATQAHAGESPETVTRAAAMYYEFAAHGTDLTKPTKATITVVAPFTNIKGDK